MSRPNTTLAARNLRSTTMAQIHSLDTRNPMKNKTQKLRPDGVTTQYMTAHLEEQLKVYASTWVALTVVDS